MARPTTDKYKRDYIIKQLKKYLKSKQQFSHMKQLCLRVGWHHAHLMQDVLPKIFEEEKELPITERTVTDLIEQIKNKHEVFLLNICSTSVSGAIFQLKANYGYKDNEQKTDVDENTIKLVEETHKKIMEAVNKKEDL